MNSYCQPQSIAARKTVGLGGILCSWFAGTKTPHQGMPKSDDRNPEVSN